MTNQEYYTVTNISSNTVITTTVGTTTIIGGYPNQWINQIPSQQVIPYNGPPAGGNNTNITMGEWGIYANPEFVLKEAIKSAIKSGIEKEEIEKMVNEALCEEVVDS